MPRAARRLLLSLILWLGAAGLCVAAGPPTPLPASAPEASQQESSHKVLVLIRLAPAHFRAASDYSDVYGDEMGRAARRRLAGRLAQEQGLTLVTDWPMPLLGLDCYVMSVPADRSPDSVAAVLSRDKRVAWAEPMQVFQAQGGPIAYNDPLFAAQPAARLWRLAELHEIATGAAVRVAVIDSMVDAGHPDLAGQVEILRNFVPERGEAPELHGTGVAGVIAARGGNGLGIVGVAPHARLMALRACWQLPASGAGAGSTICNSLSLAEALEFAITHEAQVINLSLSGHEDRLLARLIDVALARGVTVVAAYDAGAPAGGFPASHAGVIAAADDSTLAKPGGIYFAPGRGVPTTQPGGRWFLVNGSSYAAAHVSGLFALLHERSSRRVGPLVLVTAAAGGGAIDTCATLLRSRGPCNCGCSHAITYAAFSTAH